MRQAQSLFILAALLGGTVLMLVPEQALLNSLQPFCSLARFAAQELGMCLLFIGFVGRIILRRGSAELRKEFFRGVGILCVGLALLHVVDAILTETYKQMFSLMYNIGETSGLLALAAALNWGTPEKEEPQPPQVTPGALRRFSEILVPRAIAA